MNGKTAIIVAGTNGAEIAARVAAAIGDERHTSVILDLTGPGVPPEIPGPAEIDWKVIGTDLHRQIEQGMAMHGEVFLSYLPASADGKSQEVVYVDPENVKIGAGGYIFTTGDKDFLGEDGGRRLAMLPELGMGYGQSPRQEGKNRQLEVYAEGARADTLPDRISIERRHKFYDPIVDQLGVRIDGIEQDSVVEYCRSERWARIGERGHDGKLIWDFDHYKSRRVEDVEIEPYWRKPLSRQQRRAREAKMRKTQR